MPIALQTPSVGDLPTVLTTLDSWQNDVSPIQLHSGDLGWQWRFGAESLARDLRIWVSEGKLLAVGFLDGPSLIRMAIAPTADEDEGLAGVVVDDLENTTAGVLSAGEATVEARSGAAFRALLDTHSWIVDEPWTPLYRDLAPPVEDSGLRIEIVDSDGAGGRVDVGNRRTVEDRVAVQRGAFDRSVFTVEQWQTMAAGPAYRQARCLVGYDRGDAAVAAVTVWSAGAGRPGLIEPMGVHRDHRRHGYGVGITIAGAAALRDLGSSTAIVCTRAANTAGVATYEAAGFIRQADATDFRRPGRDPG